MKEVVLPERIPPRAVIGGYDLFQLTACFAGRQALTMLLCLGFGHFHGAGIIGREGIAALAGIFLFA